jgi:cytochrome oxidase Cu insertion factor (SCO1/SenC/PrrC family)
MQRWVAGTVFLLGVLFVSSESRAADPYRAFSALRIQKIAAPDFSLSQVDGKTIEISDYRGNVVLLGFFKTF